MIYVIGALAAFVCIVVGIGIGYLIKDRSVVMSLEERMDLQNRQLQLD